jgi:hypothetical protein
MKEVATIVEVKEILDKNNKPGWICKFESETQIGSFYSQTVLAKDTEVMVQKRGEYFDFCEIANDARAARVKEANKRVKEMWA